MQPPFGQPPGYGTPPPYPPHGGGFYQGPLPGPFAPNDKDVRDKSKLALILTLIGLPLCCFPLAIAGGIVGYNAMSLARARKVPTPGSAIFSMIGAALSLVIGLSAGVGAYLNHRAEQEKLAGLADKLKGKREQEKLEDETACLLAEERVTEDGFLGDGNDPAGFDCSKATFKSEERTAELRGIRFRILDKDHEATACYARGARWFVMKLTTSEECGAIHPPDKQSGKGKTEPELRALEDAARERQAELDAKELFDAYRATLAKIRQDAAVAPNGDLVACSDAEVQKRLHGREDLRPATVDHALLDASAPKPDDPWEFLTSASMMSLLADGKATDKTDALKKISEEGGDLVIVYRARERRWPIVRVDEGVISDDLSFDSGLFSGWMMVYDLKSGQRLCHATLSAANSETVRFREGRFSSKRDKAEKAVFEDFSDNLKEAATSRVKQLSPKLKLGYKLLE